MIGLPHRALVKRLTALSTIAAPYQKCAQILKGAGARGGDGGERSQEKNIKICVTMLVDIKLYVYCNS